MSYYLLEADGTSRADAESKALDYLGLKKGDLDFEVISEKKGLMSLFKGSKTAILAYPNKEDLPIAAHAKGVIAHKLRFIFYHGIEFSNTKWVL